MALLLALAMAFVTFLALVVTLVVLVAFSGTFNSICSSNGS